MLSSSPLWPKLWANKFPDIVGKVPDPEAFGVFQEELHQTAIDRTRQLIKGIKDYQNHPIEREDDNPAKEVWSEGTTKLLDYSFGATGLPVLAIPSLINRFDILDLDPSQSFLRYFSACGLRPFVIDWGEPGEAEKFFTIGDYVEKRLIPAMDFMAEYTKQSSVHVLGYCMGGLLALALALLKQNMTRSLTLLATPWHTGLTTIGDVSGVTGEDYKKLMEKLEPQLASMNYLSVPMLQVLFSCMQPTYALKKFVDFAAGLYDEQKTRLFVLTEDWLNNGVPLTAPVARELLGNIYGENVTGKLKWTVGGQLMDPKKLTVPSYVVVPGKDKIVPPESALPLARLIRGSFLHEPMLGHVGLMSSLSAPKEVWAPLTRWLGMH